MDILLWLVPAAVVTVLAMLWVGWLGREGRGVVDPEVAVRRLADALSRDGASDRGARGLAKWRERRKARRQPRYAAPQPPRDRSTGVAVRPTKRRSGEAARGSSSSTDRRAS